MIESPSGRIAQGLPFVGQGLYPPDFDPPSFPPDEDADAPLVLPDIPIGPESPPLAPPDAADPLDPASSPLAADVAVPEVSPVLAPVVPEPPELPLAAPDPPFGNPVAPLGDPDPPLCDPAAPLGDPDALFADPDAPLSVPAWPDPEVDADVEDPAAPEFGPDADGVVEEPHSQTKSPTPRLATRTKQRTLRFNFTIP